MKRTLLKYDEDRPNVFSVIFINDENGYVPIVVNPIPFFFITHVTSKSDLSLDSKLSHTINI